MPVNQISALRRAVSRMALGSVILMLGGTLGVNLFAALAGPFLSQDPAYILLANDAGMYLAGLPLALLVWNTIPGRPMPLHPVRAPGPVLFFWYGTFALTLGYLASLLTQLLLTLGGLPQASPAEELLFDLQGLPAVVLVAVVPAVLEELVFRGILYQKLSPYGEEIYVVFSGLMFGLFHGNLSQLFFAFALGCAFALLVSRTGSIAYSMILHFLVNFLSIAFVAPLGMREEGATLVGLWVPACMALGVAFFVLHRKALRPAKGIRLSAKQTLSVIASPGFLLLAALCILMAWLSVIN